MEVEALPVVSGMIHYAAFLRGRDVVWYIDNASVLAALVKGASSSYDVDRAAAVVALLSAQLQCRVWFEYVESHSNWADQLSRSLVPDEWMVAQGFSTTLVDPPVWPWETAEADLVEVISTNVRAALG